MLLVTAEEMRRLDRLAIETFGVPGYTLMRRAGTGAARFLLERVPRSLLRRGVLVLAGKGNNGGDGFVVASVLRKRKVPVRVGLLGRAERLDGDAARAMAAYRKEGGKIFEWPDASCRSALVAEAEKAGVLVDAVFGTGLRGPVSGWFAEALEACRSASRPVFAVDIPSGLDADRGVPLGPVLPARWTATFGFAKVGQVVFPGAELVGELRVVDIGIPEQAVREVAPRQRLLEASEIARHVPRRRMGAHKGDAGHVWVVAGSRGKTGAARLAALGALRAGAGLVTVASPRSQQPIVASSLLEAMTEGLEEEGGRLAFRSEEWEAGLEGKRAVVFGPGIGTHEAAESALRWLLENSPVPLVVDADGLTCLARDPSWLASARAPVVLTPHPGEMARLLGSTTAEVQSDRVGVARSFARTHGAWVVLKGARTVVAEPDGFVSVNPTGNPAMASGGMGDVLAGIVGAFLAQGLPPSEAACLAVFVHGMAGDRLAREKGPIGILASEVADGLPGCLAELVSENPLR
ncbi:MAG: bifunctional NAD(P)H-hydrate repair enzyme [Candidatus Binatia bacterium]|nr:MAG: bifunctional NAD(P)H-hydrate repair enzyme [Candidatus Binatia bacterium]